MNLARNAACVVKDVEEGGSAASPREPRAWRRLCCAVFASRSPESRYVWQIISEMSVSANRLAEKVPKCTIFAEISLGDIAWRES